MSEQLPYNDEQWNDLPLPDGEASWQKMKLLLDKDKKRRPVPFWLWRYAALGLLLISIGVGGWLWISSDEENKELSRTEQEKTSEQKGPQKDIVAINPGKKPESPLDIPASKEKISIPGESKQNDILQQQNQTINSLADNSRHEKIKAPENITSKSPGERKNSSEFKVPEDLPAEQTKEKPVAVVNNKKNRIDLLQLNSQVKKDSIKTKDSVTTIISPPVVSNDDKKEEKKKKNSFVLSAGVGLQQSIAVNGQQSSSYNYNGKQNSLGDHIPSVYLRLQKNKWFAQAEFQYGVPHPVQNFSFNQKTRYDVANLTLITERFTIQKLYYHQLPLSMNYHLHKNLSVGVGGMYNILAGAVTEQEIRSKNVQTGNETISKNLVPVKGYKDSFLYKTSAGILLQTDYLWKRFSLGLRFTQNLQPFIKYTKPNGTVLDEKNNALQAILRIRLWSSQ